MAYKICLPFGKSFHGIADLGIPKTLNGGNCESPGDAPDDAGCGITVHALYRALHGTCIFEFFRNFPPNFSNLATICTKKIYQTELKVF